MACLRVCGDVNEELAAHTQTGGATGLPGAPTIFALRTTVAGVADAPQNDPQANCRKQQQQVKDATGKSVSHLSIGLYPIGADLSEPDLDKVVGAKYGGQGVFEIKDFSFGN